MKTCFKALFLLSVIGLFAALAIPPVLAQDNSTTLRRITNFPTQVTTAVASNVNHVIPIRQGKVTQLQFGFAANNTTTDPLIVWYQPTLDGTNYQTTPVYTVSIAANGTTAVIGGAAIAAATSEGWKAIKLTVVSNASARTFITTNAYASYRN